MATFLFVKLTNSLNFLTFRISMAQKDGLQTLKADITFHFTLRREKLLVLLLMICLHFDASCKKFCNTMIFQMYSIVMKLLYFGNWTHFELSLLDQSRAKKNQKIVLQ